MDITLEKIDIIRDRTGVSYKEAKDALDTADGNVVDALINIEEAGGKKWTETITVKGSEAIDKVKSVVKSGNVNRIKIKKDEHTILNIPVTAGALSAMVLPEITAVGAALALVSKCTIEVERPNKETININNVISDKADFIAGKMKRAADNMKCTHSEETDAEESTPEKPDIHNFHSTVDVDTKTTNYDDVYKQ